MQRLPVPGGGPSLSKDIGVRDMCLLHVRSTLAISSSAGTHTVSDKNCVRVETRLLSGSTGLERNTPLHPVRAPTLSSCLRHIP